MAHTYIFRRFNRAEHTRDGYREENVRSVVFRSNLPRHSHANRVTSHSSNCFSSFPEFDKKQRLWENFISDTKTHVSTSVMRWAGYGVTTKATLGLNNNCVTFRQSLSISRKRDFRPVCRETRKQRQTKNNNHNISFTVRCRFKIHSNFTDYTNCSYTPIWLSFKSNPRLCFFFFLRAVRGNNRGVGGYKPLTNPLNIYFIFPLFFVICATSSKN